MPLKTKPVINSSKVHFYNAEIKAVLRGNDVKNENKLLSISNMIYKVPFDEWEKFKANEIVEYFFKDFDYIAKFSKLNLEKYVREMENIKLNSPISNKIDSINYQIKELLKDSFKIPKIVDIADKIYDENIKVDYNFENINSETLARMFLASYGDYSRESQKFVSFVESIPFSDLELSEFDYNHQISDQKYELINKIRESDHIEVHGSYLHGTEKPNSDIDLLSFLDDLNLENITEDVEFIRSKIEKFGFDEKQYKIGEIQNSPKSDKYNRQIQTQVPFIIRNKPFESDEIHIEGALQSLEHDIYINLKIAEVGSKPYRYLNKSKGIEALSIEKIPATNLISKYLSEMFKNNGMEDDRYGYPRRFIIPLIIFVIESNTSQLEELLKEVSDKYNTDWLNSTIKSIQKFKENYPNDYLESPLLDNLPIIQKIAYGFSILRNMDRESFNKLTRVLTKGNLEDAIFFNNSSKLAMNEVIGLHLRKLLFHPETIDTDIVDMTMFTNSLQDYVNFIGFNTILQIDSHFASRSLNRIMIDEDLIKQLSNMPNKEKFKLINKDSFNRRFFRFERDEHIQNHTITRHINYGIFNTNNYESIVEQYFDNMLSYINHIKKVSGLKEGTEDYDSAFQIFVGFIDNNSNIKWEEIDLNESYYKNDEGFLIKK